MLANIKAGGFIVIIVAVVSLFVILSRASQKKDRKWSKMHEDLIGLYETLHGLSLSGEDVDYEKQRLLSKIESKEHEMFNFESVYYGKPRAILLRDTRKGKKELIIKKQRVEIETLRSEVAVLEKK